jgi:hypothetical protein
VSLRPSKVSSRLLAVCAVFGIIVAAAGPAGAATVAGNKHRARREAHHLLSLAPLPAARHRLDHVPRALRHPAEEPAVSSLIDVKQFWRVDMSFRKAGHWVMTHPAQGLREDGWGSGSSHGEVTSRFVVFAAPDTTSWVEAQLQVEVVRGRSGTSLWRVDGMAVWLDPRPIIDRFSGRRARVTTESGCPGSDRHFHDVRNFGTRLATAMLPGGTPSAVLLCRYHGLNVARFTLVQHKRFGRHVAARLANRVRALPLSHVDGSVQSCALDDGSVIVLAFAFPHRSGVALWYAYTGCPTLDNGKIVAVRDVYLPVFRLLRHPTAKCATRTI